MDDPAASSDAKTRPQGAQAVLQAREDTMSRLQAALDALPDGIVLVDTAGRIADINLVALHLTGWTRAKAIGRPLHEVLQLRDSKGRDLNLLDANYRGGSDVTTLVRLDHHAVLVDASAAPILDDDRRTVGIAVAFRNVTAATRLNDELTYHATHDSLTGVFNRRAFESRLDRAVTNAAQHGTPHALLYLDMDRFKAVNDACGHFAGDALLRSFSALLQRSLRDGDTVARMGGDEFALLLEHCTLEEAEVVAGRILDAVAEFRFQWKERRFEVGASLGMVTFQSGVLPPHHLLQRADELCYQAKANGGNRIEADDADALSSAAAKARRRALSLRQ